MTDITQLRDIILDNIDDIRRDEKLCQKYPNVCAYATTPAYRTRIVDAVTQLVEEGITDIFEALAQVENTLFTDWSENG